MCLMLDCDKVRADLRTSIFGRTLYCFQVIDSTNAYLLTLARDGAPEGTVVQADFQTAGHGRQQRKWFSAPGQNLLFSILLKPELEIDYSKKIMLATAIILANTIENYLQTHQLDPVQISFKWPNDLLVNGKKLSGILAESILRDKKIEAMVLGIGINLNEPVEKMPSEIRDIATSLRSITGQPINREEFLCLFMQEFEKNYERFERNFYDRVVDEWKERCDQFGQKVTIRTPFGEEIGIIKDVNESGYLVYEDQKGVLKALIAGEITKSNHVTDI